MMTPDIDGCFQRYADWLPGLRSADERGDDLIAHARRALIWAITATDAEPRDGWVWNGYSVRTVNSFRVGDFLQLYRRNHGVDENYAWAKIAVTLAGGCLIPEYWQTLSALRPVRAEWPVYHALYAAKDSPDVLLKPLLLDLGLWEEAQPVIARIVSEEDPYIDRFEYQLFDRKWVAGLMRSLVTS
jgi:hypothetical protein